MIQTSSTAGAGVSRFDTGYHAAPHTTSIDVYSGTPRLAWWGPIFAGAVAAISFQILFAIVGTAIGLSVLGAADDAPERGLSIGAGIWWLVTGLASLFMGGWIAGRLCPARSDFLGALHGFLAWCTVTVLSAAAVAMAGGTVLSGSLSVVGDAMAANTRGMERFDLDGENRWPQPIEDVREGMQDLAGADRPNNNQSNTADMREATPSTSDRTAARQQDDLMNVTEEERKQAAKKAAVGSWWTFVALLLGATVASIGGGFGVRCGVAHTDEHARSLDTRD